MNVQVILRDSVPFICFPFKFCVRDWRPAGCWSSCARTNVWPLCSNEEKITLCDQSKQRLRRRVLRSLIWSENENVWAARLVSEENIAQVKHMLGKFSIVISRRLEVNWCYPYVTSKLLVTQCARKKTNQIEQEKSSPSLELKVLHVLGREVPQSFGNLYKKKRELNTGDRYGQETERNTMKQNKTDDEFRVRNKTKRIVLSSGHELETKTNLSPHEQLNLRPSDTALRCSTTKQQRHHWGVSHFQVHVWHSSRILRGSTMPSA